ncbi:MAG TPA: surface-adhesin E family protein [Usitatibacter sp.]|jgi:hypothetical protein|nr:surface-adhesin E family protein [Usitatibacter sp.]
MAATSDAWRYIAPSKDGLVKFYVDPKSITTHGSTRMARVLYDYQEPQQDPDTLVVNRSTVAVMLIDCQGAKLAGLQQVEYAESMAGGKVVRRVFNLARSQSQTLADADAQFVAAKPGTPDDDVVKYVCRVATRAATR